MTAPETRRPPVPRPHYVGGRWELVRPLAEGGMGAVWVARHVITGRLSALKVLEEEDQEVIERFRREAAVTTQLRHPGIVEILDAGFADGDHTFFIAMELLDGVTLRDKMRRPESTPAEILALIYDLLDPLAAAHDRGVIHRDLKPANVFVVSGIREVPKLLDFGIAQQASARGLTQTGTSMGTPSYMAPEQALDARNVTTAADVWALGVMIYEAIAGAPPFRASSAHGVIVHACTRPHVPLVEVAPGVDPALSRLVDRCLSKEPSERPRDAHMLRAELAAFIGKPTLPPSRPATPAPPPDDARPEPPARRAVRRGLYIGLAAGALGVLTAGALAGSVPMVAATLAFVGAAAVGGWVTRSKPVAVSRHPMPPVVRDPVRSRLPCRGDQDAPVTVMCFADLNDARGRRAATFLRSLVDRHGDDVRAVWRSLVDDDDASRVAEVALEAFAQSGHDGFWGFVDLVLSTNRELSQQQLAMHAETLGLHTFGVQHALEVGRHRAELAYNQELAVALGVETGPAIFVGGVRVEEWEAVGALSRRVDTVLGRARASAPSTADTMPKALQVRAGLRYVIVQWKGVREAKVGVRRSKTVALERAQQIHARARMPETDFGVLARRFGDRSEDLGVGPIAQLPRSLRPHAAGLNVGDISPLIETDRGYHILKRYA